LTELLTPGRPCWLECVVDSSRRKTGFDLKLVAYAGVLVSVDARLPNPLVAEALEEDRLAPFQGHTAFRREVRLGGSRMDFQVQMPGGLLWVETKSVTLVDRTVALFPDAPTRRGTRHVEELTRAARGGHRAAIVFVVQRPDALRFAPHSVADPAFRMALQSAAQCGVEVHAWTCQVNRSAIAIAEQIPVELA
jgi:sugar fermentation stimulation protein A